MNRIFFILIASSICSVVLSQSLSSDLKTQQAFVKYETQIAEAELYNWNQAHPNLDLESISRNLPYYNLGLEEGRNLTDIKEQLSSLGNVLTLRLARAVELRETIPDDILYSQQWSLDQIGAPLVWDQTTGGTFADSGEDIVVAIVDDGFYADHIELLPNLWINENEIPGNGIDDDNNGYVDDYKGYNAQTNNDQFNQLNHGTRVAGIIGAKGDNNEGISGINWNVKLMLIGGATNAPNVIECYEYIKIQKELYISSNGSRGANIVVTSFSGGIPNLDESNEPEWCDLYNSLGNLGILSVGAVENDNVDYAVDLDLPTRCSSDFLIMTTNTDQTDAKVFLSGYSDVWVDLAAPGEEIPSVSNFNDYSDISGTSASAPHVAGAIALLYSLNCEVFNTITSKDDLALTMKEAIMSSVLKTPSLSALTVSGGRLDIANASLRIRELCGLSSDPLNLNLRSVNTVADNIEFSFSTLSPKPVEVSFYDMNGRNIHQFTVESPSVYEVNIISLPYDILSIETSGMYILVLDNEESNVASKFVAQ